MLTKIEAVTAQGETLSLSLQDVSNGYVVKDVEGLDPVKATIVSSTYAQLDGTQYQTSRRESRNLIIKLGFEPDFVDTSVASLRSNLYRFFMPKSEVFLRFYIDDVHFVDISGRVESCAAPLFSKEPEMIISVICFKPDFIAPDSVVLNGSTVADATESVVTYEGSVETGFILKLLVDRALTEFTIDSRQSGGAFQSFDFASILAAGDTLEISTVAGSKYARLTRAGVQTPILYGVSPASVWINLFPGDNFFKVSAEGAPIPFTIEYTARYGGL